MITLPEDKSLDAICLGRAGMDLYANEDGVDFEKVSGFRKSVGGSPANIAVGMARLGSRVGIITKLSDDSVGRYVESFLHSERVDTGGVSFDASGSRTSLALTEMKPEDCSVVIYRNNAADLLLGAGDIDAAYVQSARMLIVSGTALCTEPSRSAALQAIELAHQGDVRVVLDLDYRAYTWQSLSEASEVYRIAASKASLLFGNSEEFAVLCQGSDINTLALGAEEIAGQCFELGAKTIFVKGGEKGSEVFVASDDNAKKTYSQASFPVNARKPFGAGDAYAAAICSGLCRNLPMDIAVQQGAAAAAIVVAGGYCSQSAPDADELQAFIDSHTA